MSKVEETTAAVAASPEEALSQEVGDKTVDVMRLKIKHVLTVFPRLMPSMLQVGIGTGMPAYLWHPVLDQMISEGIVERKQEMYNNPATGRDQSYTILSLAKT